MRSKRRNKSLGENHSPCSRVTVAARSLGGSARLHDRKSERPGPFEHVLSLSVMERKGRKRQRKLFRVNAAPSSLASVRHHKKKPNERPRSLSLLRPKEARKREPKRLVQVKRELFLLFSHFFFFRFLLTLPGRRCNIFCTAVAATPPSPPLAYGIMEL